jgi:oxygen-independent coproporphyrinogen-3 oxidase
MAVCSLPVSPVPAAGFDEKWIARLDRPGPLYLSYPTADRFSDAFDYGDYLQAVASVRTRGGRHPLSLYLHIPFCETACHCCTRSKIATRDRTRAATYLDYLKQEIEMQGRLFAGINRVEQLYLGGGTPTYLSQAQLEDLLIQVRRWFQLAPDESAEYTIEADPRTVTPERVHGLRELGLNRIVFGVQDFDPEVLAAVNRPQPEQHTLAVIAAARAAGFHSVGIELLCGLPRQTAATMQATLDKVAAARPDRIAVRSYTHLPRLFKGQRRIAEQELPGGAARLDLLSLCIERLTAAGYTYIGMEQFALPEDALAVAQRQGRLHRNFQGYSTHADIDLVACGVSAIGAVGSTYSQNVKTLEAYYSRLDRDALPIARGLRLDMDELLRRLIMRMLMCHFELSITAIEQAWPITFSSYFAFELEQLRVLQEEGLLTLDGEWLNVSARGRLLVRNICMVFDRHLQQPLQAQGLMDTL